MTAWPSTAKKAPSTSTTCNACCASSIPPSRWCQSPSDAIYYGSTTPALDEALASLEKQGIHLNPLRIRAFPFSEEVVEFVNAHDQVFVIEQNRDAQLQKLMVNECGIDPARFISILHYDGTPITARFITTAIAERMNASKPKAKEAAE